MKINAEDVVQAALKVEKWCREKENCGGCPFHDGCYCVIGNCHFPTGWGLAEYLRTRGTNRRTDDGMEKR